MDKERRKKSYYFSSGKKAAIDNEIAKISSEEASQSDTELANIAAEMEVSYNSQQNVQQQQPDMEIDETQQSTSNLQNNTGKIFLNIFNNSTYCL